MAVSWIFTLSILFYLYLLTSFVSKIKSLHGDYWKGIGSPNNFDPNGQIKIIGMIFIHGRLPEHIYVAYKTKIYLIRLFAFLSLAAMMAVFLMISVGWYA
jgi:hypothetical protein